MFYVSPEALNISMQVLESKYYSRVVKVLR